MAEVCHRRHIFPIPIRDRLAANRPPHTYILNFIAVCKVFEENPSAMRTSIENLEAASPAAQVVPGRRWIAIAGIVLLASLAVLAVIFVRQWPFTRRAVIQALQQQSGTTVQIVGFRQFYFPHPGCVAEEISFRRDGESAGPPLIALQKLVIVGSYAGLLSHHIAKVHAVGLHVSVPAPEQAGSAGPAPVKIGSLSSGLTIGQIVADGAQLDIARASGDQPLTFRIPKLTVNDLDDHHPFSFKGTVQIPQPPAEVDIAGKFGPWQTGNAGQTQLSGSYAVRNMDLGVFGGIGGLLVSEGSFQGVLQHVQVQGTTDIPKFVITRSGHPLALQTDFHAVVNGLNGDVAFDPVTAHFAKTTIIASGTVAGQSNVPGAGKTLTMQAYSTQARVQDLVRLFIREPTSPMLGSIVFRANVTVPPGDRPFLDKVRLQGDFGIAGGKYTNPETQKNIDVLSARARGKADQVEDADDKLGNDSYDPGRVISNVKGHVVLRDSVATLKNVSFDVPGASAWINGTYKLRTEQLDFKGQMHLDTQLSKATTGVKSFLLKIIQPFTSGKKQKGAIVSLTIGGTYHNPTYTVLPTAKK